MKKYFAACTIILSLTTLEGQRAPINPPLDQSLVKGEASFYQELGMRLRYPLEARQNGIMGLSVVKFLVNCNNAIKNIDFETRIGYGIEEDITLQLKKLKLDWKPCDQRKVDQPLIVKITYSIEHWYNPAEGQLVVNAMGLTQPLSDEELKKRVEQGIKKNKKTKAMKSLELLLMRYPYDEAFLKQKKELQEN